MSKFYTFYSYKGGSGRSTTAINTVNHLISELGACKEHPILLVDCDLESAGLTYFFKCQSKFTHVFSDQLHTTYFLSSSSGALRDPAYIDRVFALSEDPDCRSSVGADIIRLLTKHFGGNDPEEIKVALNGLELLTVESNTIKEILTCRNSSTYAEDTEEDKKAAIDNYFDKKIPDLLRQLISIEKSDKSLSEKKAEKIRKVKDTLPAFSFVDVSKEFKAEEGTVRFLGVDVKYVGKPVDNRHVLTSNINLFRQICDKNGYAAVIFDSGAGVQNTAHALQATSDVLIYCMRPTKQFRDGTMLQLDSYKKILTQALNEKKEKKIYNPNNSNPKNVILFPTAVSNTGTLPKLAATAFADIYSMASRNGEFVDNSFCTLDTCLNEVERFKWVEEILREDRNAPDEIRAYNTYKKLAKKLVEITGKN